MHIRVQLEAELLPDRSSKPAVTAKKKPTNSRRHRKPERKHDLSKQPSRSVETSLAEPARRHLARKLRGRIPTERSAWSIAGESSKAHLGGASGDLNLPGVVLNGDSGCAEMSSQPALFRNEKCAQKEPVRTKKIDPIVNIARPELASGHAEKR